MKAATIRELDFTEKKVFLRVDFNVPLDENLKIRDETRIKAALPTINFLLNRKSLLVIGSHLGRPKGKYNPKLSLKPVAKRLNELLPHEVILAPDVVGDEVEKIKISLDKSRILLLENLRFHPGEKANDPSFARQLAQNIDYYVNDAFGACHRSHASVVGMTRYVKKAVAGFLLEREISNLSRLIHSPSKPYTAILGGAKVSDKIPVIEALLDKADDILVGGAMAYTFFRAQGKDVGRSLVEVDSIQVAAEIMNKAKEKEVNLHLPLDHIVAPSPESEEKPKRLDTFPFSSDLMGLDIGPRTVEKYREIIEQASTIFWNGPMGVFEVEKFSRGTTEIAEAVAASHAFSVVGGGDSVAAVFMTGISEKISHISTGGGASLEFIARGTLPGLEALMEI